MNEIFLTAGITCFKKSIMAAPLGKSAFDLKFNMSGQFYSGQTVSINTSETPIDLGNVSTPHWAWFKNLDPVNQIQLYNGSGGAVFACLYAGEPCLVPLDPTCTPYGLAIGGICQLEYLIFSL